MKTDIRLQQDVLDELAWDPAVEAGAIGVAARDGVVTLTGHVRSCAEKHAAAIAAQRVAGVAGVVVEIDVVIPDSGRTSDVEIVRRVRSALDWNASIPKDSVKISVTDGVVTLSGEVDWAYQRESALAAVRHLIGIRDIRDQIALKSHPVEERDVRRRISAAIHRQAQIDANAIRIEIDGGNVTLQGVVDSWSERMAVRNAAWCVRGVQGVVDNISVAD